jgi:hypothetical protein
VLVVWREGRGVQKESDREIESLLGPMEKESTRKDTPENVYVHWEHVQRSAMEKYKEKW